MISCTAYTQLGYSPLVLAGTVVGLALTYLAPPLLTLAGPRGAANGLGALAWLLMTVAYLLAVRYAKLFWFWALLLPAIALFYLGATLHSAFAHWGGRGVMWKGRAHSVK